MWAWEAARNPIGLGPIAASFLRGLHGSPLALRCITSASGTVPGPRGGSQLEFHCLFSEGQVCPESLLSLALRYER